MLEDSGGVGSASYSLGVFQDDGQTSINYNGSAILSNGIFSATGDFAGLPWHVVTLGGLAVSAQLDVSQLPATEYNIFISSGNHPYTYDREAEASVSNAVPEPSSWVLFGTAALALLACLESRAGERSRERFIPERRVDGGAVAPAGDHS
jgi:hypothetical protein